MEEILVRRIVIVCPNPRCGQELSVPKRAGTLRVTCPKCRTEFVYPTATKPSQTTSWLGTGARRHAVFVGLVVTLWFVLVATWRWSEALTLRSALLLTVACVVLCVCGIWILDRLKEEGSERYYRKWFVVLMLFLLPPLGITLLWAGSRWTKAARSILTVVFGLWFVGGVLTETPQKIYHSSRDEVASLITGKKEGIYLRAASYDVRTGVLEDILFQEAPALDKELTAPEIADKWGPCIVLVKSMDRTGNQLSQGSGFVVSRNGGIATNYHVVESAHSVLVEFMDGRSYGNIRLVAGHPSRDLAVLYIAGEDASFSPVVLGNSEDVVVAEDVLAIGNPYGWETSVSSGIISGIRSMEGYELLQITAPISVGSSGGALFNMKGQVIGITTLGSQWGAQNLNFAVPINSLTSLAVEEF